MSPWPSVDYRDWKDTCDTLHAHSQVLGKLAAALAAPEPQLQHAALRLSARGWETAPLPAANRSGAIVVGLDLHAHEAFVEHSEGASRRIALTPDRPVGEVTGEVLGAAAALAGPVELELSPQEVWWTAALDEDHEHATYDTQAVKRYFAAATQAGLVLAAYRAPYRGRSTPVNAWWGSFDLAVSLFSGKPADPPSADFIMRNAMDSQEVAMGWWPGDPRHPQAAFYAYAHPAPDSFSKYDPPTPGAHWDATISEFILPWDDVRAAEDPHAVAVQFARDLFLHSCEVCDWDPKLAATAQGNPPPVT